jgi:PPK2 family polyphosphate:nucleotide phosphotransferase
MPKLDDFDFLRVRAGKKVRLADFKPDSTRAIPAKADLATDKFTLQLGELQQNLYAEGRRSLLVILQGLDASGKDGAVRHVFDEVNPTGVHVTSFKVPTSEELAHDFLWRCHNKAPARGYIGLFNRSYYEDVLVVRVHADKLLPREDRHDKNVWETRFSMIREFERMLGSGATRVLKFFLHISRDEQRERFIARQKDPTKHWKLAEGDFEERKFWDDYQHAYEKMLPATSTKDSPWYVIPANKKWARNYYIAGILASTLTEMNPQPPRLTDRSLITKKFK